jgi:hypothetical protein
MRIESINAESTARHEFQRTIVRRESLEYWTGNREPQNRGATPLAPEGVVVSLSPEAQSTQPKVEAQSSGEAQLTPREQLAADIIRRIMKALTGRDFVMHSGKAIPDQAGTVPAESRQVASAPVSSSSASPAQNSAGFGLTVETEQSYQEYEAVSFSTAGTVTTKDGREIDFSVQFNMSREFYEEHRQTLRLGDAQKIDPLVINFDGNAAELDPNLRFEFDLDADGQSEQLASLKSGSGFLALDKNGDGLINNGLELFGPSSGDGFKELARYDEDHNGFIDEGDDIYNKLRIWQRDEAGGQRLMALGQAGVGAIFLGSLSTPFQLTGDQNRSLGEVTSTSFFLHEDGRAGTIQQIDYLV